MDLTVEPVIEQGNDRQKFADFYKYATERRTLFYVPGAQMRKRPLQVCAGPMSYWGRCCSARST